MKILKYYLLIAVFLILAAGTQAQVNHTLTSPQDLPSLLSAPGNAGTEFYFSFPPCYEEDGGGLNYCGVYIVSSTSQLITVEVPGRSWKQVKLVDKNSTLEFQIPTGVAQPYLKRVSSLAPPERIYQNSAVHVFSESPVVVYGVTRYDYNSDGFLVLPVTSLGTEYIVASYQQFTYNNSGEHFYLVSETTISAAYDSTEVTFTMGGTPVSETSGGLKPGQEKRFVMHKGDVLCFASNGGSQDISGSYVKSSKPVAVVSGHQCATIPDGVGWCDYISEMELPMYAWGKEYHVTPIFGRKKNPIIRIFAKDKDTRVYRDGVLLAQLPRLTREINDGYMELRADTGAPRAMVISAEKPIYVVMYNTGQNDDSVSSDPFQMVLLPVEQYPREIVFSTPNSNDKSNNFKRHYINLVYTCTPADSSIPDDLECAFVKNGQFEWKKVSERFGANAGQILKSAIGNNIFAFKQITLPADGVYALRAGADFAAYSYGFSNYDSYGYLAGAGLENKSIDDTEKPRVTFTQECDGSINNGIVEDFPQDSAMRSNLGYLGIAADTNYNYGFTYGQKITYIAGQSHSTDWSLQVIDPSKDARASLRFADMRGNDTTVQVEYKALATTLELAPNVNFGVMKKDENASTVIRLRNTGSQSKRIIRFELEKGDQGFALGTTQFTLPFVLEPGASREFALTFRQPTSSTYFDRIGIGDTCSFTYASVLVAEVEKETIPQVTAIDYTFPNCVINKRMVNKEVELKNTGIIDAIIYYNDYNLALRNTPFDAVDWYRPYPLTIKPGESLKFQVDFAPRQKGTFTAQISFTTNAPGSDHIINLRGTAVDSVSAVEEGSSAFGKPVSECSFTLTPNPINRDGGMIEFMLPTRSQADISIYSSIGEKVITLVNSTVDSGTHHTSIPVERLSAGVYVVRMVVGDCVMEKSMVVVK
ncbi:MAG: choice-of-anchor D domain-containing protein [Ignavibacteria bacterium]|nr:choice-of-anchor D domain-containing protein [Ignavibacteria bacterium]